MVVLSFILCQQSTLHPTRHVEISEHSQCLRFTFIAFVCAYVRESKYSYVSVVMLYLAFYFLKRIMQAVCVFFLFHFYFIFTSHLYNILFHNFYCIISPYKNVCTYLYFFLDTYCVVFPAAMQFSPHFSTLPSK